MRFTPGSSWQFSFFNLFNYLLGMECGSHASFTIKPHKTDSKGNIVPLLDSVSDDMDRVPPG